MLSLVLLAQATDGLEGTLVKLLPDAVAVASVLFVVVLFLRHQAASQREYQAQIKAISDGTVLALNQVSGKLDHLTEQVAACSIVGGRPPPRHKD